MTQIDDKPTNFRCILPPDVKKKIKSYQLILGAEQGKFATLEDSFIDYIRNSKSTKKRGR